MQNRIVLPPQRVKELRDWISDILCKEDVSYNDCRPSDTLKRVGFLCDRSSGNFTAYLCLNGIDAVHYSYSPKSNPLSEIEINQVAEKIVKKFIEGHKPNEVRTYMANEPDVLQDTQRSALWLYPYVVANRTTLAYERAVRLLPYAEEGYPIVDDLQRILDDATLDGDTSCAMILVRASIVNESGSQDSICEEIIHDRQSAAEKAEPLDKAVMRLYRGDYSAAVEILQNEADNGDVDCTMFLLRHHVVGEATETDECH